METGAPSRTAYAAATHRAVHQILEGGRVFADPLAVRILGHAAEALAAEARDRPHRRGMRLFIAARARYAEESLAAAVAAGTRQFVVLGAGLDTFALRNPYEAVGLRVFEVDHPDTQAWKRRRLAEAGLAVPSSLTFAPVDFERQGPGAGLVAAGFDPGRPAFVSWLGVVPYLTAEAVFGTLGYLAGLPAGTAVVFDYADPPAALAPQRRAARERRAERVSAVGEPWLSYFRPGELAARLRAMGLDEIEDLDPAAIARRYLGVPAETASARFGGTGGHVIRAAACPPRTPPHIDNGRCETVPAWATRTDCPLGLPIRAVRTTDPLIRDGPAPMDHEAP